LLSGGIIVGVSMTVWPVDVVDNSHKAWCWFQRFAAQAESLRAVGVVSGLTVVDVAFQSVTTAPLAHLDVSNGMGRAM
jgi:hypothetical protein